MQHPPLGSAEFVLLQFASSSKRFSISKRGKGRLQYPYYIYPQCFLQKIRLNECRMQGQGRRNSKYFKMYNIKSLISKHIVFYMKEHEEYPQLQCRNIIQQFTTSDFYRNVHRSAHAFNVHEWEKAKNHTCPRVTGYINEGELLCI